MSRAVVGILASRNPGSDAVNQLTNVTGHWDASDPSTTSSFVADLVGNCDLTATGLSLSTQNGLTIFLSDGGANDRIQSGVADDSPLISRLHSTDPWGMTIVMKEAGNSVQFDTNLTTNRPRAFNFGTWTLQDTTAKTMVARDTDWHVFYWELNGGSSKLYIDGVLIDTGGVGTATIAGEAITFLNVEGLGVGSASGTKWAEAKASLGVQTTGNILADALELKAKWFPDDVPPVDPPDPPEVVDMLVGATVGLESGENYETSVDRFNTDIGADIQIVRRFFTNTLPADLTASSVTSSDFTVRHRCISWKNSMTQGQIETSLESIPDDGYTTYIAWNHEPENDGGVMTPAYFKARQATLLAACNAVGNPDIRPTVIYMFWLEHDGNPSTSTADWFPDGDLTDWVMGLDPYDTNGVRTMEYLAKPTLDLWRAAGGVEWLIAETGTQRMVTGTDAAGAAWIEDSCDWLRSENCSAVMWWNASKAYDWRMDSYPLMLAAWGNEIT